VTTPAIVARDLGKRYQIGLARASYSTLSESIVGAFKRPAELFRKRNRTSGEGTMWALKDVNIDISHGEVVGIVGRNGAGKSTLLKVFSRITEPTTGYVDIHGRVSALLEVGTGFHPELTGRENIFLNGAVLGMKKAEITRKFDEIVAFAEIEQFLDTPVKRYSSGMYVRLAFGVAAHLEPDILVVDEVLAVGDAEFQRKCLGKMENIAGQGRTVLFVSHNMGAVESLCHRAIWLDKGQVAADGPAREVVQEYLGSANTRAVFYNPQPHLGYENLVIEKIVLRNGKGEETTTLTSGEEVTVEVYYNALKRLPQPYFWLAVRSRWGFIYGANMLMDGIRPEFIEGRGMISCTFAGMRLLPQTYTFRLGVRHANAINNYIENVDVSFAVTGSAKDLGLEGSEAHNYFNDFYSLIVPYAWHLPDGKTVPVNGYEPAESFSTSQP
jgi:lipopolysaccharide transport system ATP-binding protein